jgi:pyrroloquinoline quinone biosynthesis protein B
MRAVILGAAAGGGFPQWNSNAPACRRARAGDERAPPRTQASLAVSADGEAWFLLNAAPDLRQQIEANPCLHPRAGLRSSPIAGVALTGGDVDAIAGLLSLRERQAFTLYATQRTHDVLDANPIFEVLARDIVARRRLVLDTAISLDTPSSTPSGLEIECFAVPGKVPLYLETDAAPPIVEDGGTIGIEIRSGAKRLGFIPSCATITARLKARLAGMDLVLFDGTLFADDEMIRLGLSAKTGRRMGHISVSGPEGALAGFDGLAVRRRIFIHINNSNPILLADSAERAKVEAAGWEVGHDGMELTL